MSRQTARYLAFAVAGSLTLFAVPAWAENLSATCSGRNEQEDAKGRITTGRAYEVYYIDVAAGTFSRRFDGEIEDLEDHGWDCEVNSSFASCSKRSIGIGGTSDSIEIDLRSGEWSDTRYAAAWGPGQGIMPEVYSGRSEKTGTCRFN